MNANDESDECNDQNTNMNEQVTAIEHLQNVNARMGECKNETPRLRLREKARTGQKRGEQNIKLR